MTEVDKALQHAVREGIGMAIADEVQEIVTKETRRALREREDDLTRWIRAAVQAALKDALQ